LWNQRVSKILNSFKNETISSLRALFFKTED
jgi:hypothetical protein